MKGSWNQIETWKSVVGYEGYYEVSNLGNVRSIDRYVKKESYQRFAKGVLLKPAWKKEGRDCYPKVSLSKNGKSNTYYTYRLVAEAFMPNPDNLPCVNHIDGDKFNPQVDNLEWCTYSENSKHSFATNLQCNKGVNNSRARLTEDDVLDIRKRYENGEDSREIAKRYGIVRDYVYMIKDKKVWKHI